MSNINQTIVIRTDLFQLPEDIGLISAQVAHIHGEIMREMLRQGLNEAEQFIGIKLPNENESYNLDVLAFMEWLEDPYILVKRVDSREAFDHFHFLANNSGLPTMTWTDTVYVKMTPTVKTAISGVPVGFSIGPADADKIRTIVGDLPLLKM